MNRNSNKKLNILISYLLFVSAILNSPKLWSASNKIVINENWALNALGVPGAWAQGVNGSGVKVCSIDFGFDLQHLTIANQISDIFSAAPSDVELTYPLGQFGDFKNHGTAAISLIGGRVFGELPIGVAPGVELFPAKLMGLVDILNPNFDEIAPQILAQRLPLIVDWCLQKGTKVIVTTFAVPQNTIFDETKPYSVADKIEAAGALWITSAGNSGGESPLQVGNYPTIVAVGALNTDLSLANFSQRGPWVSFMAPGVDIPSACPVGFCYDANKEIILNIQSENKIESQTKPTWEPILRPYEKNIFMSQDSGLAQIVIVPGVGKNSDYANIDVKGKIALVRRGETSRRLKSINAAKNGAVGVIIMNNVAGDPSNWGLSSEDPAEQELVVPTVFVTNQTGNEIIFEIESKKKIFTQVKLENTPKEFFDIQLFDGTSAASPLIGGVAALVYSVNPHFTSKEVREILAESSVESNPELRTFSKFGLPNASLAVQIARKRIGLLQ